MLCSIVLPRAKSIKCVTAQHETCYAETLATAGINGGRALTELFILTRALGEAMGSQHEESIRAQLLPITWRAYGLRFTARLARLHCALNSAREKAPVFGYFSVTRKFTSFTTECCCFYFRRQLQSCRNATHSKLGGNVICALAYDDSLHTARMHEARCGAVRISGRVIGKLAGWFEEFFIALCSGHRTTAETSPTFPWTCRSEMAPNPASCGL